MPREMSSRRSADASPVSFACTTKSANASFSRASGPSTSSELRASRASSRFWEASIASTSSVSRSAGLARWMTSLSSSPRPASAVPSSSSRSDRRSR